MKCIKKIILAMLALSFGLARCFSRDVQKINSQLLFSEIAENFGVEKITMADERAVYYKEEYVQFVKQFNGKKTEPKKDFKQKGKTYTIEFFDIGTNSFYSTKGKFKIIDENNQVIQVCEYDDIDEPYYGFFDADMDGCQDLMIMDREEKGEKYYHMYYWSNMKKKFVEDKKEFRNPAWDLEENLIFESFYDKTGELVYNFYEFRFGIRRFVAQARFKFRSTKEGYELRIVYSEEENQTEGDKGVYVFELPLYEDFVEMDADRQKTIRKQYEKIVRLLNAL